MAGQLDFDGALEDQVFAALEAQLVGVGSTRWRPRVIGVHVDGRDVWVQLARDAAESEDTLILHLPSDATVDDALATLRTSDPWTSPSRVLQVVPASRPQP